MICRTPVVCVYRYGRIINKTAIDLVERSFYQSFERKFSELKTKLDDASASLEAHGAQGDFVSQQKHLRSIQKQVGEATASYLQLAEHSHE